MFTAPVGTIPDAEIIKEAIKHNEQLVPHLQTLKDYYGAEHEIKTRRKEGALKNNKLVINHARYITTIQVGYLLGNPIEYQSRKYQPDVEKVTDAYKEQVISDLDVILGEDCSKYGYAYEYIYSNEYSQPVSKRIDPMKCIIVYDDTLEHKKLFAVVYEETNINLAGKDTNNFTAKGVWTVDNFEKITWTEKFEKEGSLAHGFKVVPMIQYYNNKDKIGDYEQVISLIDAYNTIQSDRVNDKEQLVEALLVLYGFTLETDQLNTIKATRVMSAPSLQDGGKAEYLIKTMDEESLETLKKSIKDDIHEMSFTPNMSDEKFSGNIAGVALRFKLFPFEIYSNKKERSFEVGLRERFSVYNGFLNTKNKVGIVPVYEIDIVFNKSLPQNDFEISQMIMNLLDVVDRETLVSRLSFVDNAKDTIETVTKENMESANAESPEFGTDQPNQ